MAFNPTTRLEEKAVQDMVHDIVSHGGVLTPSKHAKERMMERGYTYRDITRIISHGNLRDAEFNQDAQNWKYTFHGEDLDGDHGAVVIALVSANNCVIITVLSV